MTTTLLIGGPIYAPGDPFADALLIDRGVIAWIGQSEAAENHRDTVDRVVDLHGALVTPAFVDAHVHATSAGLALIGLDLSGVHSLTQALDAVERESRRLRGAPLWGHGWDQSTWPEGRAPSTSELDRASHGSVVYLSRRDVHSAAVSSALRAATPGLSALSGFSEAQPLTGAAHGAARQSALATVASARREEAQQAFLRFCASRGIASVHECAGPVVSSEDDLVALQVLAGLEGIDLVSYWGELGQQGIETALRLKARPGGDLFVDGSLGSHTAWLSAPYADTDGTGNTYISSEEVADHLRLATKRGVQAGFHAIGDAAIDAVIQGAQEAAHKQPAEFARLGHRIEHLEMASPAAVAAMVETGMYASVQPTFDWLWGGSSRMYAERLGSHRADTMNQFATWQRARLMVAFGSDAPVTPAEPWEWVRAALFHTQKSERMTARAAFSAATRAGRRIAGDTDAGLIAVGAPAALAVWTGSERVVQTPDQRIAMWSTDERAGVPGLPEISLTAELPRCLATINGDRFVYDALDDRRSEVRP